MQLTLWTYEGPPHVGAIRVATGMRGVHLVLHGPQGDTYADLLFTMIERRDERPPVTWTTFQARDLGGDTAELFKSAVMDAYNRFRPDVMLVGATCTAELLQDDPGGLARTLGLPIPVVALDLPAYSKKENWGAAETFYHLTRALCPRPEGQPSIRQTRNLGRRPRCNLLGPTALGFRHRDDIAEVSRLLAALGVDVAVIAPMGADAREIARLPEADFNVVLYPETAGTTAQWLKRTFGQPIIGTTPIGVQATRAFIDEVVTLCGLDVSPSVRAGGSRLPWYSRSVDSTYLTGKRVFIFADATHAMAAARVAADEFAFDVVGLGTYSREQARDVREAATSLGLEALITDDYLDVEQAIADARPDLVLGTQMERHIAKRLGVPCAVISAPVHVQDFPARAAPQMGFAGADTIFDTWVHPLMMGLEEHLLGMFRDDFEFNDQPSHLGHTGSETERTPAQEPSQPQTAVVEMVAAAATVTPPSGPAQWATDAEQELKKIPFFVRGKARRNTESYAAARGLATITVETLYDAKAHFSR